jgi:SGNH domain (fused to AT3 domains)/Acyltransferase family
LLRRRRAGATSSSWGPTALAGAAAILIVVAFALGNDTGAGYYHGGSVVFCLLVVALIAGVERLGPNPIRDLLSVGSVRYVGRISYALYLWHWPIILWVTPARIGVSGAALNLVRIVLMTAVAAASTQLLEEPIRGGRAGRWLTPRRIGYSLAAVSLVMVALTLGMTQGGGSSASARSIAAEALRDGSGGPASQEQQLATVGSPSLPSVHRVAVFGDSVAEMLKPSLEVAARREGLKLTDAAIGGCGAVAMTQTDAAGNVVSWQATCDSIAAHERAVMSDERPDAVIWYSGTENEPMLVDGASYPPDTPQHRRALRSAMLAAHDRLTAHGARLYLVELPPHGPPPGGCADPQANPQCAINETFNATVPYVNAQLRWLAGRYDDTTFISLDNLICRGGPPCPTTIHDVPVRPDGTHFSDTFAPRVATTLLAAVVPAS